MTGRQIFGVVIALAFAPVAVAQTPAAQSAQPRASAKSQTPAPDSQLYRNATFGIRYKIPYGWVDRTKEMREQATSTPDHPADDPISQSPKPGAAAKFPAQGDVLLAVFERPPEAPRDSVNSAIIIADEPTSSYAGLKKAEDYLGPLTELVTAKGFKSDGDPDVLEIDARELIRADFSKALGSTKDGEPPTMHQSTLILLAKGQIVSFTFIAESEDEIDELIEGLGFAATKTAGTKAVRQ